jgi:dihydrofolate synthase/folylpolyglutamate synthase
MDYGQAVEALSRFGGRGWRLGLDRMEEFVRRLPIDHWPDFVHVTGTNGKGSVTAFVQSLLVEQGWATGAYFSPYVFDLRERIQLGRSLITREDFARLVEEALPIADGLEGEPWGGLTEFEFKTGLGFLYWSRKRCDVVALEVGLGGRLDATNVIDPACSVIASIGLDHTEILGDTLDKIAKEKAGIIKPGRPVVVGDLPPTAQEPVLRIAAEQGSPVWRYGHEIVLNRSLEGWGVSTPGGQYQRLVPGIQGLWQPHNMALAIAACEAAGRIRDPRAVQAGVGRAFLPGRFQRVTVDGQGYILDGAHNEDAAKALAASLRALPEWPVGAVLLTGMVSGHSSLGVYEHLASVAEEAHFVPISFHRTRDPFDLEREAGWLFERSRAHGSLAEGLAAARAAGAGVVVVTGSYYLVGEVGRLLGL